VSATWAVIFDIVSWLISAPIERPDDAVYRGLSSRRIQTDDHHIEPVQPTLTCGTSIRVNVPLRSLGTASSRPPIRIVNILFVRHA